MADIHAAVAINLDADLLATTYPLFEAGEVGAIEWAFDSLYRQPNLPDWFTDLLVTYGEAGRLLGHGVFFSLFAGRWLPQQQQWLDELRRLTHTYRFDHVTEHFGFMTGANFHQGAPLGVPLTDTTLAIGIDRLRRIQDACQCPVGVENLAFAWSEQAVQQHGDFLRQLVEPVNGFIILDLHNVYCQAINFGIDGTQLLQRYPLDRVREIHLSGGSWSQSEADPTRLIRRDTHDDAVPDAVFDLLNYAVPHCPNLRYVVLEQLGSALKTPARQQAFRRDFRLMQGLVKQYNQLRSGWPLSNTFQPNATDDLPDEPVEDSTLYEQQRALAMLLETTPTYRSAQEELSASSLQLSAWQVERWHPAMLETAIGIAQKWRNGFD